MLNNGSSDVSLMHIDAYSLNHILFEKPFHLKEVSSSEPTQVKGPWVDQASHLSPEMQSLTSSSSLLTHE